MPLPLAPLTADLNAVTARAQFAAYLLLSRRKTSRYAVRTRIAAVAVLYNSTSPHIRITLRALLADRAMRPSRSGLAPLLPALQTERDLLRGPP